MLKETTLLNTEEKKNLKEWKNINGHPKALDEEYNLLSEYSLHHHWFMFHFILCYYDFIYNLNFRFLVHGWAGQDLPERWLTRGNAFSVADRGLSGFFWAERHRTPVKSVSRRRTRADRVAHAILEPRASSHEQCIVVTSPVPARFTPCHNMPVYPWHAEHASGLRFEWVDVFMMHIGCSRLSTLYKCVVG